MIIFIQLLIISICLCLWILQSQDLQTDDDRPNFVIFFVDDMGYGDLSYTGHPTIHTPNIDYYAYNGKIFNQWYSGYHICTGSRSALLTGKNPIKSGMCGPWFGDVLMPGAIGGLDPNTDITFTKLLKQQNLGYNTGIIGKWGLGVRNKYLPYYHGFDFFYGIPLSTNQGLSPWGGFNYKDINVLPLINNVTIIQQPPDLSILTQNMTQYAIQFINKSINDNSKYLLYVPYLHTHVPDFTSQHNCNKSLRGRYGDSIMSLDQSFGEIMSFITEYSPNTLVFFTSDNGAWLNKSISGGSSSLYHEGKWTTWEGGIHMPAFVYWKNKINNKYQHLYSNKLVSTLDIFPTILSLSGAKIPNNLKHIIDGKDLTELILSPNDNEFNDTLHECLYYYGGTTNAGCMKYNYCPGLWSIRCDKYKIHFVTKHTNWTYFSYSNNDIVKGPIIHSQPLLYNIFKDPYERYPIDNKSNLYKKILKYMIKKRDEYESTIDYDNIINQVLLGTSEEYILCCDPLSKLTYPEYPTCTCNPKNWHQFTCDPICLGRGTCI